MTEEERKEYRDLIQKKLYQTDKSEPISNIVRTNVNHKDEWVCLVCGKIYDNARKAVECSCKNIIRRDHDINI